MNLQKKLDMTEQKGHSDKIKELTDKLEKGIKDVFTSDRYREYLSTMNKFHNYSFNNSMLIHMQKPNASYVAGYKTWETMERHVRKGEKGITIFAPCPYKVKKPVEVIDPKTGQVKQDLQGKPLPELAKATEQMLNALKCLEQSRDVKSRELATLNPFQVQKRKELESDIFDVEEQIKAVKKRLSELQVAYKPETSIPESNTESVEQRRKRIQNLRAIQSQTYKEFYSLVEQNRENMAELRELVKQKRNVYDNHTEQKLKEHYADNFQSDILTKAREQAPDIPNMDGAGIRNNISHRR